ncbi:sperm flagellar protein 2-like [Frieseomelitta varia]|uniref:sperm flagellar protein 2-like n=1 Tax=Frieseomelitta varia TaxID=561572 RepID=UPI001CB6B251|nr:sperm flagellar protein 2-like [Frieseomelitta varia]
MKQEQSEELDRFACRHVARGKRLAKGDDESVEEERVERERRRRRRDSEKEDESQAATVKAVGDDPQMARLYVEWLKNRRKRATTAAALKSQMQKALLSELWERMAAREERTLDEAIARRVLDQSRYEKQIVTKLCEVREQKNVMAENQKVVKDITLEAEELEHRASYERAQDSRSKRQKEIETECARVCELRRRLRLAKIRKIRERHWTICRDVVDDLATIALNVGDHRRVNDGYVPLTLLSEWKTLFLKCQPIFDEEIPRDARQERDGSDLLLKSDAWTKIGKVDALRDALFDDYLETRPPWDVSLPEIGEESREIARLGRLVLGHVVHRLLDGLYAKPLDRSQILLSKFKNTAIVVGIGDVAVYELIRAVLDRSGVRTVRMEDAINHCLERYRQEMSDARYIDSTIIAATTEVLRELENEKKRVSCSERFARLDKRLDESASVPEMTEGKSEVREKSVAPTKTREEESNNRDKQTQTPRNIPYDDLDPVLTDTACIGKWAYEFLTLGEPITDDLATNILIEYLKSLVNAKSWVLIDYPNTYEQMSRLETALTGSTPPPESKERELDDIAMEDIETLKPRIVYEDKSDPFALNRQSRLVPEPIARQRDVDIVRRTFAGLFVRVKQQPKYLETEDRAYELLKEDAPSIDRFYASLRIARVFYYTSFDSATLKKLVRLVMGDLLERRPSEELFGDALSPLERDAKRGVASPKAAVVRQLVIEVIDDDVYTTEEEPKDLAFDNSQVELEQARPGEPNWRWIDFPLPPVLLENLARHWESLEETYVEELKQLLFIKSVHSSSVAPYADFVKRNALDFVRRPDSKQDLLHRFQRAFNAIDEDARHDADVKCELHRRVADFQTELWEMCDRRRREAEDVRKRHVDDHWTVHEAVVLFDMYVGIVQAEIDRCVDATRLLQDYYLGMAKRPLRETGVSKVVLNRIEIETEDNERLSLNRSSKPADRSIERKRGERVGTKIDRSSAIVTFATPPAATDRESLRKEIDDLMIDRQKIVEDVANVGLFRGILENVRYARGIVDASLAASIDSMKKEQARDSSVNSADSIAARGQDLALEWRYAVSYEIERARRKLDSIENVARLDIGFLLRTLQRAFHGIYDAIVDRLYKFLLFNTLIVGNSHLDVS